jgi:hypothetical protein
MCIHFDSQEMYSALFTIGGWWIEIYHYIPTSPLANLVMAVIFGLTIPLNSARTYWAAEKNDQLEVRFRIILHMCERDRERGEDLP